MVFGDTQRTRFLVWTIYTVFLKVTVVDHSLAKKSNLKAENRAKKSLQLLFVTMRMTQKIFLYGLLVIMQSHVASRISP